MEPIHRILIVDDEAEFLELMRSALEIRDFEVVTASNAVEAGMEISGKLPELILMDIRMPGINGLQACEAIKRNPITRDVPIIIISALAGDSDIKKARKIGISDYFIKPVDMEKLINRIKELLKVS